MPRETKKVELPPPLCPISVLKGEPQEANQFCPCVTQVDTGYVLGALAGLLRDGEGMGGVEQAIQKVSEGKLEQMRRSCFLYRNQPE
jgi:hypothetical protein